MSRIEVVSDTGPLISLEALADGFELLRNLCSRVLLPQAVLVELEAGPGADGYLRR